MSRMSSRVVRHRTEKKGGLEQTNQIPIKTKRRTEAKWGKISKTSQNTKDSCFGEIGSKTMITGRKEVYKSPENLVAVSQKERERTKVHIK